MLEAIEGKENVGRSSVGSNRSKRECKGMQEDNYLLGFRVLQAALIFLNPSFFFPSHTCTYRV
jgi:hypothetical protein